MSKALIKETRYCNILNQAKLIDEDYTYCIEKIFVKSRKRDEVRFSVYKDTVRGYETYNARSLDVTEIELIELIKGAIKEKIFSKEFIDMLKQELNKK